MARRDIPVKKNTIYEVDIEDLGSRGEGIGRVDGYTLFIEGALPGELVEAKVTKINKNYGFARLMKILGKSPARTKAFCEYFDRCGGCQLWHMNYNNQLKYKRKVVENALVRIGKIEDIDVKPTMGMKNPMRYRNKAQFPIGSDGKNAKIGFFRRRSHDIVDMDVCLIQHEVNDRIMAIIREFIDRYKIPVYDEKCHRGIIRHVVTKIGFNTGEIMAVIVTNGEKLPHQDKLVSELKYNIEGIKSIVQNINPRKGNVILGKDNRTLWGKDFIEDTIGKYRFRISPLSFYQVNPVQTEILYNKVLEYADLSGKEIVFDLYCGIGTISLFLSKYAGKVYGIEIVEDAVKDARINARLNAVDNAEFILGRAEDMAIDMMRDGIVPDVVVLDPPRKGCDIKLLETIADIKPEKIIYVSCNPATLARDLGPLRKYGYEVQRVQPVDMFPFTVHVETVCLMSREEK
ncbi:MAG: 23S rRNA (uracil(1939)-C(5))-methyltransferase RlmD [Clostridiales bacterium]|nr:23S rRNA (uracil(1939)-C(5))-methyltransferase RlmD [Clostridiales bacterium]